MCDHTGLFGWIVQANELMWAFWALCEEKYWKICMVGHEVKFGYFGQTMVK